ncbi:tetratricopeptide repeat protein [Actinoplanes sp. TRM 88003]|uniref:Tetratricopeptide repeat protein n=1 Tax=Paractinoplanes aksuensis TaxID=2939490 RepID=A0ABT1DHV8_9ACTN|nr:BTAD domain-containing putative transcriptional regulator [Actinoplanes aksuensis]MCO8270382.1 tetratricopeptide repeat protein [Actinoplanes aksuensis]
MDFRLLGPVGLFDGDTRIHLGRDAELPKVQCVLAALLLARARPVTGTFLDNALWGAEARNPETRRGYIGDLRLALRRYGFTLPRQGPGGVYRLEVAPERVDVHCFRSTTEAARQLIAKGDWPAALAALDRGLNLWHGSAGALEGVPGDWAAGIRRQLDRERREAATRRAEARLRCGLVGPARSDAERLVAENPDDERAVRLEMHSAYLDGDYGPAVEAYERLAQRLTPAPATRTLADRIRVRDPLLGPPGGDGHDTALPRQLPAVTAHFAGRTEEMARLAELSDPAGARLVLIYGTAGVGKSTLAVHWARTVVADYPDGQLHADLLGRRRRRPSRRDPAEVLRGFLGALGVPPDRLPATESELAGLFRSLAAGRRLLIVLENPADDEQVRALLPGSDSCLTVVTSRTRLNGLAVAPGAAALTLELLDAEAARDLLAARLGRRRLDREPAEVVAELIRLCAGLPLALAIVAAQAVERTDLPLADLAGQLGAEGRRLDVIATGDGPTDPRATFAWSYHRLPARAARLFRLLSRHPGPDFTVAAAASLTGEPDPPLTDLAAAHLISSPAPGRFTMHALLRAYAAEVDNDDAAATVRLFDHYLHTAATADRTLGPYSHVTDGEPPAPGVVVSPLPDEAAATAWLRVEALNLAAVAERALQVGLPRYAVQLPRMSANYQIRQGRWHEYHEAQLVALAGAQRLGETGDVADTLIELARALGWQGRAEEALGQAERAVALVTDPARVYRLRTLLAWLLGLLDRVPDALTSAEQALAAARESAEPRAVAVALNEVGWWNAVAGRHETALASCALALHEFEQLGDRSGIAAASDSLGLIHHRARRFEAALEQYERARALYEELPDVFEHAATLDRIGNTLTAMGRPADAADAWRRALTLFNELQHPAGAAVSQKLGPA